MRKERKEGEGEGEREKERKGNRKGSAESPVGVLPQTSDRQADMVN